MRAALRAAALLLGCFPAAYGQTPVFTCSNDPTTPVYTEIRQKNSFVLLAVGTIPGGVPCDTTQGVIVGSGVYYVVPFDKVTFTGTVKPDVVVAVCV